MKLPFLSVAYFCASHATNITLKHRTNCKSITREKLIHRCVDNQNFTKQSNRILYEIHESIRFVRITTEIQNSINNLLSMLNLQIGKKQKYMTFLLRWWISKC